MLFLIFPSDISSMLHVFQGYNTSVLVRHVGMAARASAEHMNTSARVWRDSQDPFARLVGNNFKCQRIQTVV